MSFEPVRINVMSKHQKEYMNLDAHKEVTFMNGNRYLKERNEINISTSSDHLNLSRWKRFKIRFTRTIEDFLNSESRVETQLDLFQYSMNYCLLSGQWIGIFPIANITGTNLEDKRFNLFSWRYILCFMTCSGQIIAFIFNFYGVTTRTITIIRFAFFLFFMSNCFTSVLFIRLSTKWHNLMKQVVASELNEYLDSSVRFKGNFATIIIISLAIVEHILSRISKLVEVIDCITDDDNIYEKFVIASCPWVFELGVPYSPIAGAYLMILNTLATMVWNYSDIFIICVSLYLTSIQQKINRKIIAHDGQHLPASKWRKLREDYNRATRLVRSFDDAINSIVFTSFASNLFFVCVQLYHVLGRIETIKSVPTVECYNYSNRLINGYEHTIYVTFSLMFILSRSLAVSLIAAQVHSASLVPAPSLYNVPYSSYGTEVQRFLEQIHGDTVALTGLNFFYVTKELVLSVVGTIVTYELVLVQFNQ